VIGRGPKAKGPAAPKAGAEDGTPPAHLRVVAGTTAEASDADGIRRLTGDLIADMDEAMRECLVVKPPWQLLRSGVLWWHRMKLPDHAAQGWRGLAWL